MAKKSDAAKDPLERIAGALAIIAVKGMEKEEAALKLLGVGFEATQISELLDVNPNFAYAAKSRKIKKPRAKD